MNYERRMFPPGEIISNWNAGGYAGRGASLEGTNRGRYHHPGRGPGAIVSGIRQRRPGATPRRLEGRGTVAGGRWSAGYRRGNNGSTPPTATPRPGAGG